MLHGEMKLEEQRNRAEGKRGNRKKRGGARDRGKKGQRRAVRKVGKRSGETKPLSLRHIQ